MLVLRFKDKSEREWKVPFNIKLDNNEIPIGIGVIAALLFTVAGINLVTKEVATVSGIVFTIVFFTIFVVSEKINERRREDEIHTAQIIAGRSSVMSPDQQAKRLGEAWEAIASKQRKQIRFRVIGGNDQIRDFYLGAHAQDLTEEEINLIHELWRGVTRESGMGDIRHKEIVVVALQRLAEDLAGKARKEILARLRSLDHSIRETEDEESKDESDASYIRRKLSS